LNEVVSQNSGLFIVCIWLQDTYWRPRKAGHIAKKPMQAKMMTLPGPAALHQYTVTKVKTK